MQSMRALKDNAPILIIIFLTIVSFLGILIFASRTEEKASVGQNVEPGRLITATTYVKGEASASATLVEFSDFECPACGLFYPIVKGLEQKYSGRLRVAYKHFPLAQHPNARKAAEAAEAAGEQGKFWEMHDKLFENQKNLKVEDIKTYAGEVGLDVTKFNEALDSGKFAQRVQEDVSLGNEIGVSSTPTFYLNGRKLILKSGSSLEEEIVKELGETQN